MKNIKSIRLKLIIPVIFISFMGQSYSQNTKPADISEGHEYKLGSHLCGTQAPSYEQNKKDLGDFVMRQKNNGYTQLPMRVHIVTLNDGSGGVSMDVINRELANLNYAMAPEQIEWFIKDVNYINNTTYYDFNSTLANEDALCDPNQVNDAVNVFWVNSIDIPGFGGACGYAYFPFNNTRAIRILMANPCAGGVWWDTFVHEFGHHLNVYHTHQGTENGPTNPNAENVPRTGAQANCSTTGDLLCDTAADPRGTVDANCVYNGGASDSFGNPYTPDEDDLMSYYPDACGGTRFTNGQYTRINAGLSARLGHSAYDIDGATPASVNDPSGLSATAFLNSINLEWNDNSNNETGFLVERSTDGTNFEAIPYLGVGPNNTSLIDLFNIIPSTTYYYRVKASNDDPDHYSNTASATTGSATNYTCATAYTIPASGQYYSPGPDQGNGATQSDASHAVWYTFTPPSSGTVDIYSCLGSTDTRLYIYTGSCGSLNPIANNDDACPTRPGGPSYASEVLNVTVMQNVPITIEWDDRWSTAGFYFTLSFEGTCPSSLNLTGTQIVSFDFETDGMITSDQLILPGISVDYDSGSSVLLNPGFQTSTGTSFNALIDGCGGSQ